MRITENELGWLFRLSHCGTVPPKFFLVDVNTLLVSICGPLEPSSRRCALASRFSQVTRKLTKSSKSSGEYKTTSFLIKFNPSVHIFFALANLHQRCTACSEPLMRIHGQVSRLSPTSNLLSPNGNVAQTIIWFLGWNLPAWNYWKCSSSTTRPVVSLLNKLAHTLTSPKAANTTPDALAFVRSRGPPSYCLTMCSWFYLASYERKHVYRGHNSSIIFRYACVHRLHSSQSRRQRELLCCFTC